MAASVAHDLQEIPSDGGEVLRNGMLTVFFFFFFANLIYLIPFSAIVVDSSIAELVFVALTFVDFLSVFIFFLKINVDVYITSKL